MGQGFNALSTLHLLYRSVTNQSAKLSRMNDLTAAPRFPANPSARDHFLMLDGLRGVAAIAVLLYHRRWMVPGPQIFHLEHGYLAVDFFFLLSGFVIAHAYDAMLGRPGGFRAFLIIRAIRLYPLIFLGSLLGLAAYLVTPELPTLSMPALLPNLFAFPAPAGSGATSPFFLNRPLWSLFFEICVNIAYALVATRLSTRVMAGVVCASGAALWLSWYHYGFQLGYNHELLWFGFIRCLFPFALGILLSRLHREGRLPKIAIGAPLIALLLIASFAVPGGIVDELLLQTLCIGLLYPLLVIAGLNTKLGSQSARAAAMLGILSYPIYVIHVPIYDLTTRLWAVIDGPYRLYLPFSVATVIVVSLILDRYYDVPLRRRLGDMARGRGGSVSRA